MHFELWRCVHLDFHGLKPDQLAAIVTGMAAPVMARGTWCFLRRTDRGLICGCRLRRDPVGSEPGYQGFAWWCLTSWGGS
jgi:hypothetical protein